MDQRVQGAGRDVLDRSHGFKYVENALGSATKQLERKRPALSFYWITQLLRHRAKSLLSRRTERSLSTCVAVLCGVAGVGPQ